MGGMKEQIYKTPSGDIHYWVNGVSEHQEPQLVFLPGLGADHRLFDKQTEYFEGRYPVIVWDAPGHGVSWPFDLGFDFSDKVKWLDAIIEREGFKKPVIIGQSMGSYVGQAYAQAFPNKICGFVSIDSAPLQREYVTAFEIWLMKRIEPIYRRYPWKSLLKSAPKGVAVTEYGRKLMYDIMMVYDGDKERFAALAGRGFKMLGEAFETSVPFTIPCPALLICGEKDRAGTSIRKNKVWHKKSGIPVEWIKNAGHNSNTDAPEEINHLIEGLVLTVIRENI